MISVIEAAQLATIAAPSAALGLTLFNAAFWPRGKDEGSVDQRVSVLIPARNEEATIRQTVESALLQDEVDEVCVYDDGSTDTTPQILAELASSDDRLQVLNGVPLPAGWVGKPHACSRLGAAANGELLLFLDADVELSKGAVKRIASLMRDYNADCVTAVPRQRVESWFERLILPLLHVTYVSWLPLPLIWRTSDPRFLAANGQVLAVKRDAYNEVGGFESVRDAVVDDMAFCGELKRARKRVVFADGDRIASCRMYEDADGVWTGFSKNIREGVGSTPGVIAVVALYLFTFVWPWLAWSAAFVTDDDRWLIASGIALAAVLVQRVVIAVRHRYPMATVFNVVPGVLGLCAIALNSIAWQHRDAIQWAGRTYVRRENRNG